MKYAANRQRSVLLFTMQLLMVNFQCLCKELHPRVSTINFQLRTIEKMGCCNFDTAACAVNALSCCLTCRDGGFYGPMYISVYY